MEKHLETPLSTSFESGCIVLDLTLQLYSEEMFPTSLSKPSLAEKISALRVLLNLAKNKDMRSIYFLRMNQKIPLSNAAN